jgi:chondroitin 4-sulfotransferase 11
MIDHKNKFIFIHIPKTGGSSIESIFYPSIITKTGICKDIPNKHYTLDSLLKNEEINLGNFFSFSFIRNPWDKVLSHYLFFFKGGFDHHGSFFNFVKYYCDTDHKGWKNNDFLPQFDYLSLDDSLAINFIGKFENLQEDFDEVCDRIGISRKQLPITNKTERKHYAEYYDEKTKQIVAEKYAKDIEYFGYEFGE